MHCSRAGVDLGTSFDAKMKPLLCGQAWSVSDENGVEGEQERHLSGRGWRRRCAWRRSGYVVVGSCQRGVGGRASDGRWCGLGGGELAGGRR